MAFFKDFAHAESEIFRSSKGHEGVEVIRHQDIGTEPCAMVRAGSGEVPQGLVDRRCGENFCAILGIGGNEVDRISFKKPFEATQTLGHGQIVTAVCDRR